MANNYIALSTANYITGYCSIHQNSVSKNGKQLYLSVKNAWYDKKGQLKRIHEWTFNEAISIPVPYGHHYVMAKFMDYKLSKYKGVGLECDVTPDNRIVYLKAARVIPGYGTNTTILEPATAEEMPPV